MKHKGFSYRDSFLPLIDKKAKILNSCGFWIKMVEVSCAFQSRNPSTSMQFARTESQHALFLLPATYSKSTNQNWSVPLLYGGLPWFGNPLPRDNRDVRAVA
jgi:hypothetical protein